MKPITKQQILDYLIHHCELKDSSLYRYENLYLSTEERWFLAIVCDDMPFLVVYTTDRQEFLAVKPTPWAAYEKLAEMLYEDIRVHAHITEAYYKALK